MMQSKRKSNVTHDNKNIRMAPIAGFSVGAAMGRNKLIYSLADYAIIVASDAEKGGTWAGATQTLNAGWVPVFVVEHAEMPEGNRKSLEKGAIPLPYPVKIDFYGLPDWLEQQAELPKNSDPKQLGVL